ncbi:MAG: hypothetical protein ABEJ40_04510 [Haloarculaceae archaeon]
MSWGVLFDRAADHRVTLDPVREEFARRRERDRTPADGDPGGSGATDGEPGATDADPGPERVVADADVLAADLLVGGAARDALDDVRAHSWVALVASDALLDDAEAVIAELATPGLAADWRERVDREREPCSHPAGDHPALASAARGGAMHLLTFDEDARSASAGAAIRGHVETSVKHPRAFAALFDASSLYAAVADGEYPGPDRDPRA